jgi:hypothetical protein
VKQRKATKVVKGAEAVFVHEGGELVEHFADAAIADFHDIGAGPDGARAEEDELGDVVETYLSSTFVAPAGGLRSPKTPS